MTNQLLPPIGDRIRAARISAGERREHLAVAIGRSTESVSQYERGLVCPPLPVLASVAEHYGLTLTDLVGDDAEIREGAAAILRRSAPPPVSAEQAAKVSRIVAGAEG